MPTFKISKSKKLFFYQKGLNKAFSDIMEHQVSLRKFSKYNNIDFSILRRYNCRAKNPKNMIVVL